MRWVADVDLAQPGSVALPVQLPQAQHLQPSDVPTQLTATLLVEVGGQWHQGQRR